MSAATAQAKLRTPQQLYEDWERSHWSAQEVDLSRDGDDWARLLVEQCTQVAERDALLGGQMAVGFGRWHVYLCGEGIALAPFFREVNESSRGQAPKRGQIDAA